MEVPAEQFARRIVERLQSAGYVAYFAGGCVRDRLMGRVPKDFDVATSARPEQVLALYPRGQQVGAAFGVILLVEGRGPARLQVEVATFRADGTYSDGRHPDAVRFTTAEEDAQRRDFTCNGLFFDPVANVLHDFVGGQADIQHKVLRAIGDPAARFAEDHLRMLRAVRFAAKLEFTIEERTLAAIRAGAANIKTVSKERIHDELAAILSHPTRARAAALLEETGLLPAIWPAELMSRGEKAQWLAIHELPANAEFATALVALFSDIPFERPQGPALDVSGIAADYLRRDLMLTNSETADFAWLASNQKYVSAWRVLTKAEMKRLMADRRWPQLEMLYSTVLAPVEVLQAFRERVAALRDEGVAPEPFITGDDLIKLGADPGPKFKAWLETLYDRQLEGDLKTREEALAAARQLIAAGSAA